jgi:hypothetical protein
MTLWEAHRTGLVKLVLHKTLGMKMWGEWFIQPCVYVGKDQPWHGYVKGQMILGVAATPSPSCDDKISAIITPCFFFYHVLFFTKKCFNYTKFGTCLPKKSCTVLSMSPILARQNMKDEDVQVCMYTYA